MINKKICIHKKLSIVVLSIIIFILFVFFALYINSTQKKYLSQAKGITKKIHFSDVCHLDGLNNITKIISSCCSNYDISDGRFKCIEISSNNHYRFNCSTLRLWTCDGACTKNNNITSPTCKKFMTDASGNIIFAQYVPPTPKPSTPIQSSSPSPSPSRSLSATPPAAKKIEDEIVAFMESGLFGRNERNDIFAKNWIVMDLSDTQSNNLHTIFDNFINNDPTVFIDSVNLYAKKHSFYEKNYDLNNKDTNGEDILFVRSFYYGNASRSNQPIYTLHRKLAQTSSTSDPFTMSYRNWFADNILYAWNLNGNGIDDNFNFPRVFMVDKKKESVYFSPDFDDFSLKLIGEGYPVNDSVYTTKPVRIGSAIPSIASTKICPTIESTHIDDIDCNVFSQFHFKDFNNKMFIFIPSHGKPCMFFEIALEKGGNIVFRGIHPQFCFKEDRDS